MERDKSIDVMKGILIVLVVMAHAQGPGHRFIYLFHMATFFMISGYLWKTRSNLSKDSVFIRRKIKSLYFPYVICNGAFLLIFLLLPSIFDVAMCEKTWGGVIEEIIKILLLDGRCSMSGATWFVAILFEINILCYLIEWGAYKVSGKKYQYSFAFRSIAAIVLLCNGYLLMRFRVNSMQIGTLCSAYATFHLGNIMKVIESRNANVLNNHRRLFGVLSVGVLVCLLAYNTQEIRLINNQIINPYYYLTAACSGWFMIRALAFILIDNCMLISRIFVYIGKKSMYILCCHLLSFKIVAVLQCMVNKDFSGIANHPVAFAGGMWWILYTVAGITVPIMGAIIVDKIREFS